MGWWWWLWWWWCDGGWWWDVRPTIIQVTDWTSVRPERFPGLFWRTHGRKCLIFWNAYVSWPPSEPITFSVLTVCWFWCILLSATGQIRSSLRDLMLKPAGPWMDPYFHLSIHCILIVFYCGGRGDRTAAIGAVGSFTEAISSVMFRAFSGEHIKDCP